MTETPTPAAGSGTEPACPHCGEPVPTGSNFCEGCGKPTGTGEAVSAPAPASEGSPADDLGSGPISAITRVSPGAPEAPAGRRPCLNCGGGVGPDGYCEQCGTKAPTERDHFREQPAAWVAGVCDRGITHSRNEDAMALLASVTPGERAVLIVLDGVSNTDDSDVASLAGARAAREVLRTPLPQGMGTSESRQSVVTKAFADAVEAANRAVVAATPDGSANPPSATFVSAILEGEVLWFANVGDSRAYWLPDGATGRQLSVDDSGAQMQIAAGVPRKVAETGPHAHSITRWLGHDAPDLNPRVGQLAVDRPGWVLVCSDGLWNYASEPDELVAQIQKSGQTEPGALALALTEFANACGGQDNITVALARLETGQNAPDTDTDSETPTPEQAPTDGESDG